MIVGLYYKIYYLLWRLFSYEVTLDEIWSFQKSFLSPSEIELAEKRMLVLTNDDPRNWILDQLDQLYCAVEQENESELF